MSTLRKYWMVVPEDLDVLDSPDERYVNNDLLPAGYIPAYESLAEFLEGAELTGDCCSYASLTPRKVVLVEADGVDVIHPWEDQGMDCVYVQPLKEIRSAPLKGWLEHVARTGDDFEREQAAALLEDIQISIDAPLSEED